MAFAMIITVVGFLLLFDRLGIIDSQVWSFFWPLLIIVIGLSMMYNKMHGRHFWDDAGSHSGHRDRSVDSRSRRGKSAKT